MKRENNITTAFYYEKQASKSSHIMKLIWDECNLLHNMVKVMQTLVSYNQLILSINSTPLHLHTTIITLFINSTPLNYIYTPLL